MRRFRSIFLSFLAGALLVAGFWYDTQGSSRGDSASSQSERAYFEHNRSVQDNDHRPVSGTMADPLTSGNIIADMVKQVGPAVVAIETETTSQTNLQLERDSFFRQFFGSPLPDITPKHQGLGSGFIIRDDGYILTNYHVIDRVDTIKVTISGYDEAFTAEVIGTDPELDLAVLKVTGNHPFPSLVLGDSDKIEVGEWSVAIGNPYGLDHTVTVGVISAKGRPLTIENQQFKNLLQTDASINPGNSGGPLLNLDGEVIGINTAINSKGQGLGFAIPINMVTEVLTELIEKGKVARPWLGVSIQDVTEELATYFGASSTKGTIIAQVMANSPAAKAGLQQGDIILEIDGVEIENAQALVDLIAASEVGAEKKILIIRQGNMHTVTVTIDEKM